jgi:secondary thiamine-phosphate synthase enzyme
MEIITFSVSTGPLFDMKNITQNVRKILRDSKVQEGMAHIFIPHTTAGVTINENADPHVVQDLIKAFNAVSPDRSDYLHGEGNSRAHFLSSIVGPDLSIMITKGKLLLGTWQDIYFCEFDGPRSRKVHVRIVKSE